MKLAFYRASTGSFYDRLIDRLSGNIGFAHVELVISPTCCFSASPGEGVRFRRLDLTEKRGGVGKWELVDVPTTLEQDRNIERFCDWKNGDGYDYLGLLRFIWPRIIRKLSSGHEFCSEVCLMALQRGGKFQFADPLHISPNELYLIAKAAEPVEAHA